MFRRFALVSVVFLLASSVVAQVSCPDGCSCLTQSSADSEFDNPVKCLDVVCGYELGGGFAARIKIPKYCFREGLSFENCLGGCLCLTKAEGKEEGLLYCEGKQVCGLDDSGALMYCFMLQEEEVDTGLVLYESPIPSLGASLYTASADEGSGVSGFVFRVSGNRIKECSGLYCTFTGAQDLDISAEALDGGGDVIESVHDAVESTMDDLPQMLNLTDFNPCPYCPEKPEYGVCVNESCEGADMPDVYDSFSNAYLTGCNYEEGSLAAGTQHLGEGLVVQVQIADPVFDYCTGTDGKIVTHWCPNGKRIVNYTYMCPMGCENGRCVCEDTDGKLNYFEQGYIVNRSSMVQGTLDYCISDSLLRESYTNVVGNKCLIKQVDYTCPGYCENGSCHGTCSDGLMNNGEVDVDCGGPCPPCMYSPGWYVWNYGFSFSNPAGRELSYGDCWSYSDRCGSGYGHYKESFGNCEVCICNDWVGNSGFCGGWHVVPGLYYLVYKYAGASAGQCTGMSLSSLQMYYGDRSVSDYQQVQELNDLSLSGTLKDHISAMQGKVISKENIYHYCVRDNYWGANDVLGMVESELDQSPPKYGMIFVIEDEGWGGWRDTVRQTPSAHTLVADSVEDFGDLTRIYLYDSNAPLKHSDYSTNKAGHLQGFSKNVLPYIDIDKNSDKYDYPFSSSSNWSNRNDEEFDRIGYIPYNELGGDVDVPHIWDILIIGVMAAFGSADAAVVDGEGRVLGYGGEGRYLNEIPGAYLLPVYGERDSVVENPRFFAVPGGNYTVKVSGVSDGNYSMIFLGDNFGFVFEGVKTSAGVTDSVNIYPHDRSFSISTSSGGKLFNVKVAGVEGNVSERSYLVDLFLSSGESVFLGLGEGLDLVYSFEGESPVNSTVVFEDPLSSTLDDVEDQSVPSVNESVELASGETHVFSPAEGGEPSLSHRVFYCGDGVCDVGEKRTCSMDCLPGASGGGGFLDSVDENTLVLALVGLVLAFGVFVVGVGLILYFLRK
ncbi:MAG: hypothetical protein U9M95_06820 [Candidatus Altiarchaeota archaeon]|nr:hypothetical protein [Candidatus Altiarchaeota archaeon]